jgi:hypothetical protein
MGIRGVDATRRILELAAFFTDGELVLRYPVSNEVKSSSIGYPSVAAALADLHSRAGVKFHEDHGWTIAEDAAHYTFWSFPPAGDPAFPSPLGGSLSRTVRA